ncbi:hypothetical protein MUU53_22060 [Rhizobium lemnae]|uniref:Uncharacterized protein n=1 Tax=Rhizobium lemnae TaxID=1214924 RepID=A0ABV8ECX3_9HYPH|nr:hypothetical protein [Rhizobium lemnae]MCJ8510551.1 hypothetical protein [Rhizobium lemnae]
MSKSKKDFELILKIRSIRADRAERNMAIAEDQRVQAVIAYDEATALKNEARKRVRNIDSGRFAAHSSQISGRQLKDAAMAAREAKALLQDAVSDVFVKSEQRKQATLNATVLREVYNSSQKMVIKTEAVIEQLSEENPEEKDARV